MLSSSHGDRFLSLYILAIGDGWWLFCHGWGIGRATRDPFNRACNAAQRRAEIGKIDHRKQQPRNPKNMIVGEQGNQRQNRDDLHLHLACPMSAPFRNSMELKVQVPDHEDGQ